jgi:bacillopeptidase F (M6 metalloprotease family)
VTGVFGMSTVTFFHNSRLGGTFTLPADSPTLKFWVSYDIESYWDYAFVEINEVGTDTWTTLPDLYGLTTDETGDSCAADWVNQIHPFLAHYMDADCNPTGTTGSWNAFTSNSGGWQQVEMDLSAYAGKTVELYISYVCDWATQGLGVFVDDVELSGYPLEDFEVGMGQ